MTGVLLYKLFLFYSITRPRIIDYLNNLVSTSPLPNSIN